jgi:hypothetical protein
VKPLFRLLVTLIVSLTCTLIGCGDDFAPPSLVSNLRLLAVQADRPFAQVGDSVRLTALAHDPEQRRLSWGWGLCIDDASSLALDCLRATSFESLTIAQEQPEHMLVVPEAAKSYVGVVVVVCPGTLAKGDTFAIPIACLGDDGRPLPLADFELGIKRIFVRDPALNRNPMLSEVLWDGAPWLEDEVKVSTCERTQDVACVEWPKHRLELRAPEAAESSIDRAGEPLEEQAVVQFYATGGEYEHQLRNADDVHTTWQARSEDSGELITLWFVVRDDRGGVSWLARRVRVP